MYQIYIHLGGDLPSHAELTIRHNAKFSKSPIFLLTEKTVNLDSPNVKSITVQSLNSHKVKALRSYNYLEGFWLYTFERLFILEEFMNQFAITDCVHIENDVLIYSEPQFEKYRNLFSNRIALNLIGERYATFAYSYITLSSLTMLTQDLLFLLSLGKEEINERTQGEMLNEMTCVSYLFREKRKYLDFFPIMPEGEFSKNYSELGFLYDAASYGQFLDGTPGTLGQAYRGDHHYVGRYLNDSDRINFKNGKPILIKNKKEFPLFNLHIHSKRIGFFTNN